MNLDRPWLTQYAPGVPADVEIPNGSVAQLLERAAAEFPERSAFEFFGASLSYSEAVTQVRKAAQALLDLGLAPGDRVALALPNCTQHAIAFYAALRIGAIVVEHNPLYTAEELRRQLADHSPRLVISWSNIADLIKSVAPEGAEVVAVDVTRAMPRAKQLLLRLPLGSIRRKRSALTVPTALRSWDDLVAAAQPLPESHPQPDPTDIALLQYTGGTTGVPKAAVLTHRNLVAQAAQDVAWCHELVPGQETFFAALPIFHVYGLTTGLTVPVLLGATIVLFPKFDPDLVLDAQKRTPCTFLPGVPPMYPRLVTRARERKVSLKSIRFALAGAMSLPPEVVELWEGETGGLLVEGYGMTESSPVTVGNPVYQTRRTGSIGVPFPSTYVKIVHPENPFEEQPPGEPGELLVHGPQVFIGYWNRADETAKTLLPGGWLRTGDIVVQDADGFIRIVDRLKELILVGGFNVYPSEVEEVLRQVPGVADATVTAVPADDHEEVLAAVVLSEGSDLDVERIRTACRERLAAYKVPRRVVFVNELPRTIIGKVLRREVRDRYLRGELS